MPNYSEQRKHIRVKADFTTVAKPIQRTQFEGKILSLSEGGAFLATEEKLRMGSDVVLFLTLEIPGSRKSSIAQGKVVWANSDKQRGDVGCGIAFEEASSSLRKLIGEFVEFKRTGKVTAMGVAQDVRGLRAKGRGQLRG
jgi:Tfp pilus assembly protein PilZ